MSENEKKGDPDTVENALNPTHSKVPGRLSLEDLHRERAELEAAKKATSGVNPNAKLFSAMSMFNVGVDFALLIALPLIVAVYVGRWLDARYGTQHYVLIGILGAIFVSAVSVYRQVIKLSKQIKNKK